MKKLINTTKKTSLPYLAGHLIEDALFFGIGIFCSQKVDTLRAHWRFGEAQTMETVSVLLFIFAFLSLVYHLMVSGTYADVYCEKIIGKGVEKITVKNFNLSFTQITDITRTKGFLNSEAGAGEFLVISTASGSYKIITTSAKAQEIITYYNEIKAE